jgi:DNA mismatch repair protein MutL
MDNLIRLLPEKVANQIAAGEVVQRPSSVVKELVENAIDAGATSIQIVMQNAGRALIQVIDDGKGMNEVDARMCFERHATSKIQESEDLFRIRTMGFRGEAMASIAAVAQVELKTRQPEADMGHEIHIAGSKVQYQGVCATPAGTIISVKNLFFNVPARRNFLKNDQIEFRHVLDAFERIALAYPEVAFKLVHNGAEIFNLPKGKFRQRILQIMGAKRDEKLVPVEESTPFLKIHGFISRPEAARKRRGEQFFFVNLRYIKSQYLHHAVLSAFDGLLPPDFHPMYFIYLEIDPKHIDINIHPTKTEIKFDDEKTVYAILRSTVKRALGMFQVSPTIDFEIDQRELPQRPAGPPQQPVIPVNPNYNPFDVQAPGPRGHVAPRPSRSEIAQSLDWYVQNQGHQHAGVSWQQMEPTTPTLTEVAHHIKAPFQIQGGYVVCAIDGQLCIVHQRRAHQRILFEHYSKLIKQHSVASQQLLFPQQLDVTPGDFQILQNQLDHLRAIGFDVDVFGNNSLVVNGMPIGMEAEQLSPLIDNLIDAVKNNGESFAVQPGVALAKTMAKSNALASDAKLTTEQMESLVKELLECEMPTLALNGKPIFIQWQTSELDKRFQ